MSDLIKSLREVAEIRKQEQVVFDTINKQSSLNSINNDFDGWNTDQPLSQSALREQYEDAFRLSAEELRVVSECLDIVRSRLKRRRTESATTSTAISAVRASQGGKSGVPSSSSGTSKKSKVQGAPVASMWVHDPASPLKSGLEVAALTEVDCRPQMWILAAIGAYKPHPNRPSRYTVIDLDPGDHDVASGAPKPPPKRYDLDPKRIIPLPSLLEVPLSKRKEIRQGDSVLALYPIGGVTTFYEAVVVAGPKKRKDSKYSVLFSDDGEEEREVEAQYVLPWPGILGQD